MATLTLPGGTDPREVTRFVREVDRRLQRFDQPLLREEWDLLAGHHPKDPDRRQLARTRFLSDPALLAWVRRALPRPVPPSARRRLELLERVLLDAQVEQAPEVVRLRGAMQRRILAFRPRWNGRPVNRAVVLKALHESPDRRVRRRAYYAGEPLHRSLEAELRELTGLRNDRARALGHSSFAEMRLASSGLTVGRLMELTEAVAPISRRRLRAVRDAFCERNRVDDWYPWDFSYARRTKVRLPERAFPRAGMVPRVLAGVRQWGFPVDQMRFRVVYHDLPAGGMTLAPDPPRDVRIMVHPTGGWLAHMILFHEFGHAVHSASIRAPPHLLHWSENIPGFGPFHEGIGSLFEEIPSTAAWLSGLPGISRGQASAFEEAARYDAALDAGWQATWLRLEQALIDRPEGDPAADGARFERRLFGYDEYPPLSFVDPFFVESPVYSCNYLLAILFSQQLRRTLRERCGEPLWPNPRVGPWLTRHWFRDGSTFEWVARMRAVSGAPFGAEAFRREMGA